MFLSVFLSGEVVATIAGDKSVVNMNLYRSNQSQQIQIWESSNSTEEAAEDLLVREKTLMLGLVVSMYLCYCSPVTVSLGTELDLSCLCPARETGS